MNPKDRVIVALDVSTPIVAAELIREIHGCTTFKIGHYLSSHRHLHPDLMEGDFRDGLGTDIRQNPSIFWDLKYFDIPDTVFEAVRRLTRQCNSNAPKISMCTVHSETDIMLVAVRGALGTDLKVLAVTMLTSMNDVSLRDFYHWESIREVFVYRRVIAAREAGCHGVICSPQEVKMIREIVPSDFLIVVPGIRPEWYQPGNNSHKRIGTPRQAIDDGADYIVVGRPIITDKNPIEAFERIVKEIS